jgi:hypothetical protein
MLFMVELLIGLRAEIVQRRVAWMGHKMGHYSVLMRHHFVQMGHEMGHHSAKMGHEGTPTDTKMVSHAVIAKQWGGKWVPMWFLEAKWLKNRLKVA